MTTNQNDIEKLQDKQNSQVKVGSFADSRSPDKMRNQDQTFVVDSGMKYKSLDDKHAKKSN